MLIKSISIKEGLFKRFIEFSPKVNLIYSEQNSKGKTTLLRFLLYSLGYNIPSTKNIRFDQCEVEAVIEVENIGELNLFRMDNSHIVLTKNGESTTYILPEQRNLLHGLLFGTKNIDILENLLGAFYVDQEKGWTMLNRGKPIGSLHFNIEALLRGLSGRNCTELIQKEFKLSQELGKYRQMFSIAKYQETIEKESGSLAVENFEEKINCELEQNKIKKNSLEKELHRIDYAIRDNNRFKKFISEMKLLIKGPDGTKIQVNADNIEGFEDNLDYLKAKRTIITTELKDLISEISKLERNLQTESEQLSFWNSENITQAFDRKIASLKINPIVIDKEISRIKKELDETRLSISNKTRVNNQVANSLYTNVLKYAKELGVGNETSMPLSYLFTSNLKELSGAILHKTIFAFRLAYIIEIERAIGVKLPIILDSPSGKEVDSENIKLMMNILKRDFSDHQIIIASIFRYYFDVFNEIKLVNRLVE